MSWSYPTVRAPNRSSSCRIRKKPKIDDTLYPDYLMHHGIKGQQWGIRRYQNEDGTLTEEGKLRYNDSSPESKKWDKRETSYLTDEELNRRNLRLQREQQYRNLTTTDKERDLEQLKKDFKKKVLTAALITPVVAIVGIAAKKYMGSATSKVGGLLSKFGKTVVQKIKTGNLLKQAASRGHEKYMKRYPHDGNGFLQSRPNELDRTFDFVKREAPLWRRKVII